MKTALRVVFWINIVLFAVGLGLYLVESPLYNKVLGAATLYLAAVLMPFFLFYRYDFKRRMKEEQEEVASESEE